MIGMLNRLHVELFAFAVDPFGWLQRHPVGPQSHIDSGEACNALGVVGDARVKGTEDDPATMHLHNENGDAFPGETTPTNDPSFCVDVDTGFWDTGIGSSLLKACGYGAAFLLAFGAYQGVRAAMRGQSGGLMQGLKAAFPFMIFSALLGMIAALPSVIIPTVVRMIELTFDLLSDILG